MDSRKYWIKGKSHPITCKHLGVIFTSEDEKTKSYVVLKSDLGTVYNVPVSDIIRWECVQKNKAA